jgi:hypothetical protein
MTIHISGAIDVDVLEKIRNHPLRGDRTLSEFYEFIFRDWVNSPHSQEALLQEKIHSIENELEYSRRHAEASGTPSDIGRNLAVQAQQLMATEVALNEVTKEVVAQESSASADGATLPGPDVLEGDFLAILQAGETLETESRSYVDLTLRVIEGPAEGAVFKDRIVDFPWHPRSDFLRRALEMQAGVSIIASLPTLLGKKIQVRRTKKALPDGATRAVTFYHRVGPGTTQ